MPRHLIYIGKNYIGSNHFKNDTYLENQQIKCIFSQVTKLLLRKNSATPPTLFNQYISNFFKGQHAILQSYQNISRYNLNKICFLASTIKIFDISQDKHHRNGQDYIQLLRLVCSDFPKQLAFQAMRLVRQTMSQQLTQLALIIGSYNSKLFVRAIAMVMLYQDFFSLLEKKSSGSIKDYLRVIMLIYQNSKPRVELPPFNILAETLLKLCQGQDGSQIELVDESNIDKYMIEKEIKIFEFKKKLLQQGLGQYLQDLLNHQEIIQAQVQDIIKILNDKPILIQTSTLLNQKEKKKKNPKSK